MASSYVSISVEEFKAFHTIDRELYRFLAINLGRDPVESMHVLSLWLWMESAGFRNVVFKILSLPYTLINQVSDEAVLCLSCINNNNFVFEGLDIPLIQNLMDKDISLRFIHMHRERATEGISKYIQTVCIRAFSDIMQQAIVQRNQQHHHHQQQQTIALPINNYPNRQNENAGIRVNKDNIVPPEDRTMFVTFSRGYVVREWEVRDFFTRSYGECIESLQMQEVDLHEQPLFAKIVFKSMATIHAILNGNDKVKFNINGKHVWARKFVPKRPKFPVSNPVSNCQTPSNPMSNYSTSF